eukprot:336805-Prymnesium_polylepis.1
MGIMGSKAPSLSVEQLKKGQVVRTGVVATPKIKRTWQEVTFIGACMSAVTLQYLNLGDARKGTVSSTIQEQTNASCWVSILSPLAYSASTLSSRSHDHKPRA